MARMLSVDAEALKKPILGRSGNGAGAAGGSGSSGGGAENPGNGDGMMDRSNVRLAGLGTSLS